MALKIPEKVKSFMLTLFTPRVTKNQQYQHSKDFWTNTMTKSTYKYVCLSIADDDLSRGPECNINKPTYYYYYSYYSNMILRHEYEIQQQHNV